MITFFKLCCFFVIMLLLNCSLKDNPVNNQNFGAISGEVTDLIDGSGISHVLLFTRPATSVVTSDSSGNFIIKDVLPDVYTVLASKHLWYGDSVRVRVHAGKSAIADIQLKRADMDTSTNPQGQKMYIFQPGPEYGKDAAVWNLPCSTQYAQQSGLCHNVNEGDAFWIRAASWTYYGAIGTHRSFIAFDLRQIQTNAIIDSASLYLYSRTITGQTQAGDNAFAISRVIEDWDEHTIIWDNQPAVIEDSEGRDFIFVPRSVSATQDYKVDITEMVQFWVQNPQKNYGMRLKLIKEEPYARAFFASCEATPAERRPKLVVYITNRYYLAHLTNSTHKR